MNIAIGYLLGVHLLNQNLHNHHPVVEVNDTVMVYENSFEKASVAAYKTFRHNHLKLRVGLTTGYYDVQEYKGYQYGIATATKEGVGLFLVPSFEKDNFVAAIIGDSINAGFVWRTK